MFSFIITHSTGRETVTIEASSSEKAYAKALNWALLEGLVILRCTLC
jgi:hypothetical protein